jgi:hypothetical protein
MIPARRAEWNLAWWLALVLLAGMLTILLTTPLGS